MAYVALLRAPFSVSPHLSSSVPIAHVGAGPPWLGTGWEYYMFTFLPVSLYEEITVPPSTSNSLRPDHTRWSNVGTWAGSGQLGTAQPCLEPCRARASRRPQLAVTGRSVEARRRPGTRVAEG